MSFDPVSFAIGKKAGGDPPAGSAATPETSIAANPALTVSGGDIVASVSASESITPTVVPGYVSTGTVTASGSTTVAATALEENLIAENIRKDIVVFGITGTFEGGRSPKAEPEEVFALGALLANEMSWTVTATEAA